MGLHQQQLSILQVHADVFHSAKNRERDTQTNRQTDKRQTQTRDKQTRDKQTRGKQTRDKQTRGKQTRDKHTNRQTDKQTNK